MSGYFGSVSWEYIELSADMSILDCDKKQMFVCHKAVGWLFFRPVVTVSFLLSIYESNSTDDVLEEIEQLLYWPLIISYPGEVKKYLQACIKEKKQTELCERLLDKLERYHGNLEKVRNLKELRAPLENINIYKKHSHQSMQKARDKGPRPVFEQFCTPCNILYGNSVSYYINDGSGGEMRQVREMYCFSHSSEMPMLDVLDPVNLDYMLRLFRIWKDEK